ncbi:hypothetical protein QJS04_geneDACA006410 [Acorus gramineus]|uniref:MORF/ORRM1/DAG-like MORF domain-containing protein n=1 Tax=Acorus gramineus TaxID=55184 RepID=A0AAV9AVT4_ACOGR|nr:hypothetical protein QJS04_geneDACA006410 [Acorus gramineus]
MALARGRTLITTASLSRWLSLTRTSSTSVHHLHPSFTSPTDLRLPLPPPSSSSSVHLYSVPPPNHGDPNPPSRTMALNGCDFEHWHVVMRPPEGDPSRDEIIDGYVKTLAQVLGRFSPSFLKSHIFHSSSVSLFMVVQLFGFLSCMFQLVTLLSLEGENNKQVMLNASVIRIECFAHTCICGDFGAKMPFYVGVASNCIQYVLSDVNSGVSVTP